MSPECLFVLAARSDPEHSAAVSNDTPRMDTYLACLPDGLASYPEAEVRSDVLHAARELLKTSKKDIPDELHKVLSDTSDKSWHPEVMGTAATLACRDLCFGSDEEFLTWAFDSSRALFTSPLNKMLMLVLSPTLIVIGATKRWQNFHSGSELQAFPVEQKDCRTRVVGRLSYPPDLFPELIVHRFGKSVLAALSQTRADDPVVEVAAVESTACTFHVSWVA